MSFAGVLRRLAANAQIWWEVCLSPIPRGLWEGTLVVVLTSPLNWPCREDKKFLMLYCVSIHLKNGREMGNGTKAEQKNRSKACKTLTVLSQELFFFSSLWSIHGWTLWHLICRADETLPCLNWSGFVSSLLSHDPLLYGSVRGGGNPLEYTALVGLLFASCRPTERMLDWSYFMLGLTLSSTRLHHISCSLLFLPPFFFALPYRPPNPTILKTPHAARREEGICYSVKLLWFFMEVLQLKWYTFPCGA